MSGITPNFSWILPSIGGDTDVWGSYTNTNWTSVDALIRSAINCFASATQPAETEHGTLWLDTTSNPNILKIYDGAQWAQIGLLNTTLHTFTATGAGGTTVGDFKTGVQTGSHSGWLLCDGSSVSTTTYAALFALIGYQFGGAGATFNLPDPRGRALGCIGAGTGLTVRALGDSVGEETHVLTSTELPDPITTTARFGNFTFGQGTTAQAVQDTPGYSTASVANQGGNQPHQNMQPTLFIGNLFIYSGV